VSLVTPWPLRWRSRLKVMSTGPSQGRTRGPLIGTQTANTQASRPGAPPPTAVPVREYFPGAVTAGLRQAPMAAVTSVARRMVDILPVPLASEVRVKLAGCGGRNQDGGLLFQAVVAPRQLRAHLGGGMSNIPTAVEASEVPGDAALGPAPTVQAVEAWVALEELVDVVSASSACPYGCLQRPLPSGLRLSCGVWRRQSRETPPFLAAVAPRQPQSRVKQGSVT
jgi:hypothetical protein